MSFIFGEGTPWTYDQMQAKRKIAEQLMSHLGNTPQNVGEGLHAIGKALMVRGINKRADKRDAELRGEFDSVVQSLMGGQAAKLADVYDSPYANEGHKAIARKLMGNLPQYRTGTNNHPGGYAIVGEDGPEIVNLPKGSQVVPNPATVWQQEYQQLTDKEKAEVQKRLQQGYSPEEAIQPKGYDPREMLMDMSSLRTPKAETFVPGAEYKTADMSGIDPASLPYGDAKLTGDQSKAIAYYRRGFGANQTLSDPKLSSALTEWDDSFAGNFGALGRMYQSEDYQVGNRAAKEFLAAILRKDTGAAITSEEFDLYGPMYLPQPGDKPATLEAKSRARNEALIAIQMGLGTAAPLAEVVQKELTPSPAGATHRFNPDTGKIEVIK